MNDPAAIKAYRQTHTVAETMERFSIGERAVYKACAKVKADAPATPPQIAQEIAQRPARVLRRVEPQGRAEMFHTGLSEIADESTEWVCPYTGESYPQIPQPLPGTTKAMWLAERLRVHHQRQYAPPKIDLRQVQVPVHPVPETPAPPIAESLPQSAPVPRMIVPRPAPVPVHLHQSTPLAMQGYDWISRDGVNWHFVTACMVALVLIGICW